MFSPPYGDGTAIALISVAMCSFSPPYGDGTIKSAAKNIRKKFSPPYGDGTDTRYQFKWNSEVFAPLRGWYSICIIKGYENNVFAPLRGWYCLNRL